MESGISQTEEQKKKGLSARAQAGRFKKMLLFFLLLAHVDFFLSQTLGLPLSMEQLFTLGYSLLVADSILLAFFLIRLFRPAEG